MPRELEVSNPLLGGQQPGSKRSGVRQKILLKPFLARADVGQQVPLILRKRDDRPFVENRFLVPRIHLLGAGFYQCACLIQCHITVRRTTRQSKASPTPANKAIHCRNAEPPPPGVVPLLRRVAETSL